MLKNKRFITIKNLNKRKKEREMLKVLKNLKQSAASVIVIIILLCVQAATDLALPTYTSKIVNVGIQARWDRKFCT